MSGEVSAQKGPWAHAAQQYFLNDHRGSKGFSLTSSCKGDCDWVSSVLANQKVQILAQIPKEKAAWHSLFACWSDRILGESCSHEECFDDYVFHLCSLIIN